MRKRMVKRIEISLEKQKKRKDIMRRKIMWKKIGSRLMRYYITRLD